MPTDSTLAAVLKLVEEHDRREGADLNRSLYVTLLNQGLDEISANLPDGFDTYWTNDSSDDDYGRLTLSGQTVTFPSDLRNFPRDSVLWDGGQLSFSTIEEMDIAAPEWRGSTGTPSAYIRTISGILLDVEPSGTTDAMLTIYGKGCLPHYEDGESLNPLKYLTHHHQLGVADYIIANLPIVYEVGGKVKSDAAIQSMRDARANAYRRWRGVKGAPGHLPLVVHDLKARARSPLGAI